MTYCEGGGFLKCHDLVTCLPPTSRISFSLACGSKLVWLLLGITFYIFGQKADGFILFLSKVDMPLVNVSQDGWFYSAFYQWWGPTILQVSCLGKKCKISFVSSSTLDDFMALFMQPSWKQYRNDWTVLSYFCIFFPTSQSSLYSWDSLVVSHSDTQSCVTSKYSKIIQGLPLLRFPMWVNTPTRLVKLHDQVWKTNPLSPTGSGFFPFSRVPKHICGSRDLWRP